MGLLKKLLIICLLFGLSIPSIFSQSILFNSSGGTPHASSLMELRSTEKGFLPPRMNETQRLNITSPAQGLTVFQTTGTVGYYFYNGTGWDTLGRATTVTNISNVTNVSSSGIAVIRDEKTAGTDGGAFNNGAWRQRDLNSIAGDLSFVSLGTNSFILDTGVYVITASAPANRVAEHQIRLYNVTDGLEETVGTVAASQISNVTFSTIYNVLQVSTTQKEYIIEHQCATNKSADGFGIGAPWGSNVYTQVKIEKL